MSNLMDSNEFASVLGVDVAVNVDVKTFVGFAELLCHVLNHIPCAKLTLNGAFALGFRTYAAINWCEAKID